MPAADCFMFFFLPPSTPLSPLLSPGAYFPPFPLGVCLEGLIGVAMIR